MSFQVAEKLVRENHVMKNQLHLLINYQSDKFYRISLKEIQENSVSFAFSGVPHANVIKYFL